MKHIHRAGLGQQILGAAARPSGKTPTRLEQQARETRSGLFQERCRLRDRTREIERPRDQRETRHTEPKERGFARRVDRAADGNDPHVVARGDARYAGDGFPV